MTICFAHSSFEICSSNSSSVRLNLDWFELLFSQQSFSCLLHLVPSSFSVIVTSTKLNPNTCLVDIGHLNEYDYLIEMTYCMCHWNGVQQILWPANKWVKGKLRTLCLDYLWCSCSNNPVEMCIFNGRANMYHLVWSKINFLVWWQNLIPHHRKSTDVREAHLDNLRI